MIGAREQLFQFFIPTYYKLVLFSSVSFFLLASELQLFISKPAHTQKYLYTWRYQYFNIPIWYLLWSVLSILTVSYHNIYYLPGFPNEIQNINNIRYNYNKVQFNKQNESTLKNKGVSKPFINRIGVAGVIHGSSTSPLTCSHWLADSQPNNSVGACVVHPDLQ